MKYKVTHSFFRSHSSETEMALAILASILCTYVLESGFSSLSVVPNEKERKKEKERCQIQMEVQLERSTNFNIYLSWVS